MLSLVCGKMTKPSKNKGFTMGKNYESFDKGFVFNTPFELAKFLFTQTHILPRDIHIHLQVESLHA